MEISPGEVMVAQAAREIQDGERVFVGMRLPLIAFVVAKRTHAPNAVGLFELGVMRDAPAAELLYTMGDPSKECSMVRGPHTRRTLTAGVAASVLALGAFGASAGPAQAGLTGELLAPVTGVTGLLDTTDQNRRPFRTDRARARSSAWPRQSSARCR